MNTNPLHKHNKINCHKTLKQNHKSLSEWNFFKNESDSLSKEIKMHYKNDDDKTLKIRKEQEGLLHTTKQEKIKS